MLKRAVVFLVAGVLAFAFAGCSSSGSSTAAPADQPQLESLAISQGKNMVSDGEYLYFTDGGDTIYRSDLDMESVVVLDQPDDGRVFALCLADGKLYYSAEAREEDAQGNGHHGNQIRCVETDGKNSKTIIHTSSAVSNIGVWQDMLVYVDKGALKFVEPDSGIEKTCAFNNMEIVYAQPADEGIYFTARETDGDAAKLCLFGGNMTKPDTTELIEIGHPGTFALCGSDIYFLADSDESTPSWTYYELAKLDAQGNVTLTGVTGVFGNSSMYQYAPARLCAYGDFIFYSNDELDKDTHTWKWVPYCYNTVTGQETVLEGDAREKTSTQVSDVVEGYVFLRSVSTGAGTDWVQSLLDPGSLVDLPTIVENAEKSSAAKGKAS